MIPVCEPTLSGKELEYVTDCLKTGWISSMGKYISQFEEKFSAYCGVQQGVACCNGTAALHLAIEACRIGKGDEVIVPTFTMVASANAVLYSKAKPVFVDSEPETWNIDVAKIEEKITQHTKAIMPVHIYGHPVDMKPLLKLADKYNLYVIEDAAEAHGAEYYGRKVGGWGQIAAFSFYANKIITTGEGGMVITNDHKLAERAKQLRNHFFGEPRFLHQEVGYNYRMTNIQGAIGLAQLEKLDQFVDARRRNAKAYNAFLKNVEGLTLPPEKEWAKNVYWMYGLLINKERFGRSKDEVMKGLYKLGVDTRSFFIPMHKQPIFKDLQQGDECPIADQLAQEGLYLPSSSSLSQEQIATVCDALLSLKR